MPDLQEQLALLRRKMASIDRKYADGSWQPKLAPAPPYPEEEIPAHYDAEQYLSGEVVATSQGEHFETGRLFQRHRRHGSIDISSLAELPDDLLASLSDGAVTTSPPSKWAFLDTETTGLAGGSGTYAFLVGVGSITPGGFRLKQFFMRDYGEEASLLAALSEHLSQFDVLITYNGKIYDQPLLETRYRMARIRHPFSRMQHLDLLFGARRLWKLRLESCRLVELENRILGVERHGDLPGEMIPHYYFEYLRTKQAFRLAPIIHHNAIDILSLACLTAVVPAAFRSPHGSGLHHGADLLGLARWLMQAGRETEALRLFRQAVDLGLSDELLFRTLWDIALLEKKLGNESAALVVFSDLAACRNAFRVKAYEELAKYYEHSERNFKMALEMVNCALDLEDTPQNRRREERLKLRLAKARGPRLPLQNLLDSPSNEEHI